MFFRMGDERSRRVRSCCSAAFCFVVLLVGAAQKAKADFAGNFFSAISPLRIWGVSTPMAMRRLRIALR